MSTYRRISVERHNEEQTRDFVHGIVFIIFSAISLVFTLGIKRAIDHGYGKHLLILWLFGLPMLLAVWAMVGVIQHVHADPSLFLAGWQAHFARHPDQANWAWVVKDFVDLCRW
jgi:hypothetical protein